MPISVLVVDDDAGFRQLAAWAIVNMGHAVAGAVGTVADALRSADELRPDAALVDVGLPDGDGRALALRLAALPWRPRIVVISSDQEALSGDDVRQLGVAAFVPKLDFASAPLARLLAGE